MATIQHLGQLEGSYPQGRMPNRHQNVFPEKDVEEWSRRSEDEMVRGLSIQRGPSERMTLEAGM